MSSNLDLPKSIFGFPVVYVDSDSQKSDNQPIKLGDLSSYLIPVSLLDLQDGDKVVLTVNGKSENATVTILDDGTVCFDVAVAAENATVEIRFIKDE